MMQHTTTKAAASQLSDDEDENEPVLAGYAQDPYAESQDSYANLEL
jgi:hypothetical protein